MNRPLRVALCLALYTAAIVAANVATARLGLVPVLPGLTVTAGTYAAGLALGARDLLHDVAGRRAVFAALAAGAVLSALLASPALAVASGVAFLASEMADLGVYTPLRRRGWVRAVLASNVVGAVVDTLAFLAIAGFPATTAAVAGQLTGKVLWATLLPVALVWGVQRAVPRDTLREAGA